ncbi:hypothetical protein ACQ4LE_005454 [Meloidogyne hapla]
MNNLNIKLDILKCLNFDQLNNFQQINRQFSELIYKNEKVLACKIFEEISITDYNIQTNIDVTGHWLKMTEILEKIPLNEKLEEKWQNAINKHIPLYLCTNNMQDSKQEIFINLERKYFIKNLHGSYLDLKLELPLYPKNIKEMKIIRCWLEKLFTCYFGNFRRMYYFATANFNNYIINPEITKILFDNEENIQLKFNIETVRLNVCNPNSQNVLKFILEHLNIGGLLLNFENQNNPEEYNDILFKLFLNEGKRITKVICEDLKKPTVFEQIMKHIETSTDCSNIVSEFNFRYIYWRINMSERAENIEYSENTHFTFSKYHISNINNPKVKFSIYTNGYVNRRSKKFVSIKRIEE